MTSHKGLRVRFLAVASAAVLLVLPLGCRPAPAEPAFPSPPDTAKYTTTKSAITCPETSINRGASPYPAEVGEGPVYAVGLTQVELPSDIDSSARRSGGYYFTKVLWIAKDIQAFNTVVIDGGAEVRFGAGSRPIGRLVLKRRAGQGVDPSEPDWLNWPSYVRVKGPGCYRLHLTAKDISQEIVFEVTPGFVASPED